jgi:hypothetical protein
MTTTQKLIQPKMGLLKLAEKLGNVSEACKVLGYSTQTVSTVFKNFTKKEASLP